jgi:hypothetical protein
VQYRYNRGHWKYFDEENEVVQGYTIHDEGKFVGRYDEHFSTDFLVDRGIEFIESAVANEQPFALTLSIPDPHGEYHIWRCYGDQQILYLIITDETVY